MTDSIWDDPTVAAAAEEVERVDAIELDRDQLTAALNQLADLCNGNAEMNGWNSDFPQREDFADGERGDKAFESAVRNWDAVKVSLFASEAFEAFDELRKGKSPAETYYPTAERNEYGPHKPEGVPSEIVDILVRIFHYAGFRGVELGFMFFEKLDYNDSRGHRHGGKGF